MNYAAVITTHTVARELDATLMSTNAPDVGPREFFALRGWMISADELAHLENAKAAVAAGFYNER